MADLHERLTSIDGIGEATAEDVLAGAEEAGLIIAPAGESEEVDGEAVLTHLEEAREYLRSTVPEGHADKQIRQAIELLRPPEE